TENGISKLNSQNGKIINSDKLNLKGIKGIFPDNKKNIWAVTNAFGIYRISNDNYQLLTTKHGLSSNSIYCGMNDREGNLWFGTDGSGMMKYCFSPFSKLTEKNGLFGNMVLSILHDSKGNEWYGTEQGVTQIYSDKITGEKKINYFLGKNSKYLGERIWSTIEDSKGNIWFSTFENGIYKYDGNSLKNYTTKDGLASDYVRSLCEDKAGNIWIGTMGGLNRYDGGKFMLCKDGNGKNIPSAMAIFKDSKDGIWFASNGGLFKYTGNENQFLSFSEKDGLPSNGLLSIAEDVDGNIWCAGFNGISRVDMKNKICKNISIKEGLTSNSVYILSADKKGNLFVGNNIGIDKINIAEYNRTGKVIVKHYGKDEGFTGIECNTNASTQDKDGGIWFGTIKGAIRYDASLDVQNTIEPITHILNVNLFFEKADWSLFSDSLNEKTALPENLELPYNKNHLTFNCLALSLSIPEKIMYSFKLEGFDQLWSPPSHQTSTTYSYLPPGDYTFLVKAMNNDGVWNSIPSRFSFSIIPPFWKTWWFYLLSFAALVLTLTTFYKLRFSALQKRAIQLQEHVDSKTLELRKEKETVELQHKIIEKKNQNIMASINYAQRIQNTVLPIKESLQNYFPQSFILLKPRDIVSGDFYWFREVGQKIVIAAIDCTGHGIPGAFMSLIGNNLLNNVVYSNEVTNPSHILHRLHEEIVITLKKTEQDSATVDGMDVSICVIDKKKNELEFASTGQPLIFVSEGKTEIIKSGKYPLGLIMKKESIYETQKRKLLKNDTFYLFTDGYVDQFGEYNDEKFSEERLKNLVKEIQKHDMPTQLELLNSTFMGWKGKLPQLDDTLVIGIRI
ncbi:MAG TPA: two-component regulator propeller domain-containing protein, partial [Bacteroidia bacterium]|nr:two-component regulator propeller domain-containing protein [Bacteroidia bacterium]